MIERIHGLPVSIGLCGLAAALAGCDLGGRDPGIDAGLDTDTVSDSASDSASATDTDIDSDTDADSDTDGDTDEDTCADDLDAGCTFSFFVFGDNRTNTAVMQANVYSMYSLDPEAIALFSSGDLVGTGSVSEWQSHHQTLAEAAPDPSVPDTDPWGIVRQSRFRTDVDEWGDYVRYFGAVGNHDQYVGGWLDNWNMYLVGQAGLGINEPGGVYFFTVYNNIMFIVLDSVHASAEQRIWLEWVLSSDTAASVEWKVAFFHYPVYPCDAKGPFSAALPWVRLFEQHGVDLVFTGHSHTYERTCPMIEGGCVEEGEGGVVYINSSGGGAPPRAVYPDKVGTVNHEDDTDEYNCAEILAEGFGFWWHFCHIQVEECLLTLTAYPHDLYDQFPPDAGVDAGPDGGTLSPWDSVTIDKCG